MKAYYPLDNSADDMSGHGLHGTAFGTYITSDHLNQANSALQFNGISDYIALGSAFDFPRKTISLWVKADTFPSSAGAIYASDNPDLKFGMTGITAINDGGVNKFRFNIGANWQHFSNAKTKTWYFLTLVVNDGYVISYVNGVKVDSMPNNSFLTSSDGSMVAHLATSSKNTAYFKGSLDDVRIFDCALGSSAVYELYTGKTDCLLSWYKMDGNGSDSKNSSNATVYGTVSDADRFGIVNSALKFNGENDYVALGSAFDLPLRTITLWVKVDSFPTTAAAIYACDNPALKYGMTGITALSSFGGKKFRFNVGVNQTNFNNAVKGKWYFLAMVTNSTYIKCFVNGQFVDSLPNNSNDASSDGSPVAHLGAGRNVTYFFKGVIDDVKIYNCPLSNSEVRGLYVPAGIHKPVSGTFKVSPNPAKEEILIRIPNDLLSPDALLEVYDFQGRQMVQRHSVEPSEQIHVSEWPSGVYFVRFSAGGIRMTEKISVIR